VLIKSTPKSKFRRMTCTLPISAKYVRRLRMSFSGQTCLGPAKETRETGPVDDGTSEHVRQN
jgi:hypothetical protein